MAVNNTAFLAPILYSEIIITMENATDGTSLPNGRFTLQSLKDHGNVTIGTGMIGFWVDSDYLPEYVKIFITVHEKMSRILLLKFISKSRKNFFMIFPSLLIMKDLQFKNLSKTIFKNFLWVKMLLVPENVSTIWMNRMPEL